MGSSVVMRGLDPRIHQPGKKDGLPGLRRAEGTSARRRVKPGNDTHGVSVKT
jgi:hypothetical protein